jgi:hypothetical protein
MDQYVEHFAFILMHPFSQAVNVVAFKLLLYSQAKPCIDHSHGYHQATKRMNCWWVRVCRYMDVHLSITMNYINCYAYHSRKKWQDKDILSVLFPTLLRKDSLD